MIERAPEVSRATHRFLVLLREFDLRQGWKAYGKVDCALLMKALEFVASRLPDDPSRSPSQRVRTR